MTAWQEEPWTSPNAWRVRCLRLPYRWRVGIWVLWWASLLGVATAIFSLFGDDLVSADLAARARVLLGKPWAWILLAAWIFDSLLLVLVFGWFGVRFRYLAWGVARLSGALVRFVRVARRGLFLLVVSLFLAWLGFRIAERVVEEKVSEMFTRAGAGIVALSLFALAIFLWGSLRARQRIVVHAFRDQSGLPALEGCAKGLSERLCGELASISQLYRTIDQFQGSMSAGQAREKGLSAKFSGPAIEVLDVGDILQGAVSAEASIDLRFLKIPVGPVLRLGRRLLHERWLSGSLHHHDGSLLLLAGMTGGDMARNWRVGVLDLDEEDRDKPSPVQLDRMVEQLAFRIATDLVPIGSPKWRAVRSFTEGLRAFREARRSEVEKTPRLLRAERAFRRALREDSSFAKCHYNLGVVYSELGQLEAAEAAFRLALQYDPEPSAACYALAERYFTSDRLADAIWFAQNAIRTCPTDEQAWSLKALALYYHPSSDRKRPWTEILVAEEIAVALAWRDLCFWLAREAEHAVAGDPFNDRRERTTRLTMYLAVDTALRGLEHSGRSKNRAKGRWLRRATRISRQASLLSPRNANANLQWAWALIQHDEYEAAVHALDRIFAGGFPTSEERLLFWCHVLASRSALARRMRSPEHALIAAEAFGYLLDTIGIAGGEDCEKLIALTRQAWEEIVKARDWVGKELGRPPGSPIAEFSSVLESLPQRLDEGTDSYVERLKNSFKQAEPTADGPKPNDLTFPFCDTPAFYAWRLETIIVQLDPAAVGAAMDRSHQPRLESLDWLRRWFDLKQEATPEFVGWLESFVEAARNDRNWSGAQRDFCREARKPSGHPAKEYAEVACRLEAVTVHSLELIEQGVYAEIAYSFFKEARRAHRDGNVDLWQGLLRSGLKKAEEAVLRRPDGAYERSILGLIYFELDDYRSAEREWEESFRLQPDPEVLNWAAEARWRRGLELANAEARRAALRHAVQLFGRALELCETDPAQLEARGQAHFWLGVFHRELLELDEAIYHHKVACAMGARPLEAKASLGWTYLEAGLYAEAERTFEEVREALVRQPETADSAPSVPTASGPGEPMPVAEVTVRTNLGLALLYAEKSVSLEKAETLIAQSLPSLKNVRAYKKRELTARCHECLAQIQHRLYQRDSGTEANLKAAFDRAVEAIEFHARADGYWILAGLHLSRAEAQPKLRDKELRRAREACERARRCDLRGRLQRDLEALESRIAEASQS